MRQKRHYIKQNCFGDLEVFIVEAVEVNKHQPLQDQVNNWTAYCVCDNRATADAVIKKDMERGDILRGRISSHTIQTKEMI